MSRQLESHEFRSTSFLKARSGYVKISTCFTFDAGWETMVFPCDEIGHIIKNRDAYPNKDLYSRRYSSEDDAVLGHSEIVLGVLNDTIPLDW